MKIFFSCTTHKFAENKSNYFAIRDYIVKHGHIITHDWLPKMRPHKKHHGRPQVSPKEYKRAIEAVEEADVLIFENTVPSFSTGHLLTIGLQLKKPILVMWLDSSPWTKRRGFIESLQAQNLELNSYTADNYTKILHGFLKKYEKAGVRYRFNLVIDPVEKRYLDWVNYNRFTSRTTVIRNLIRAALSEDKNYQEYLRQ